MSDEWKFAVPIYLTKAELLALSDLSGDGVSMKEYTEKVIREHIAAQQGVQADAATVAAQESIIQKS